MLPKGKFLACDWGTTRVRAWVVDESGAPLSKKVFPLGVSKLAPGEAEVKFRQEVRHTMKAETLPALLCGMIGSNLGWVAVAYQPCPADLQTVAHGLYRVEAEPGAWIVPGLCGPGLAGAPDVMRCEETQIIGWVEQDREHARGRHVLCHPGTHAKWTVVENGRIMGFLTAMTGELFELLRAHSVLRNTGAVDDPSAFDEGVMAAGDGGALSARLFTARSRVVTGLKRAASTPSYLSGLLIGAEISGLPMLLGVNAGERTSLLGEPELCRWYARAMGLRGIPTEMHDGEAAVLAGLKSLRACA